LAFSFDVKLNVLSSHHEDNFFRLRIEVWDPMEKNGFAPLHIVTAPVKVISKPMKKSAKAAETPMPLPQHQPSSHPSHHNQNAVLITAAKPKSGSASNKRKAAEQRVHHADEDIDSVTESMIEHVDVLQRQQTEALRLLNMLVEGQRVSGHLPPQIFAQFPPPPMPLPTLAPMLPTPVFSANGFLGNPNAASAGEQPSKRVKLEPTQSASILASVSNGNKDEFEGAFSTMLRSYAAMSAEEKAEKTRRVVRSLPHRDLELLEELCDILATAGVRTGINAQAPFTFSAAAAHSLHGEQCGDDCAHKEELMRIDQFYSEVFF